MITGSYKVLIECNNNLFITFCACMYLNKMFVTSIHLHLFYSLNLLHLLLFAVVKLIILYFQLFKRDDHVMYSSLIISLRAEIIFYDKSSFFLVYAVNYSSLESAKICNGRSH